MGNMLRPEERRLAVLAACIRAAVLLMATVLDVSLPDYDTSKFITPGHAALDMSYSLSYSHAAPNRTTGPPLTDGASARSAAPAAGVQMLPGSSPALLQGWLVWDSVFFADITARGYVYEQYYAFFPLLPALAAVAPGGLFAALILALNAAASVTSTVLLYRLGERVTNNRWLSALACLFFILNPATIFHAAAYTESAFFAATLAALYGLYCRGRLALAVAAVAVSCGLRSNGVVNAGYLGHFCLRRAVTAWPASRVRALGHALLAVAAPIVAVTPLVAFQYAGYTTFCRPDPSPHSPPEGGGNQKAPTSGRWARPWCSSQVPYIYGFVQAEYWDVGFLRYWTLQQLPNFLLAAPVLLLSAAGLVEYCRANGRHLLLRLGLTPLHRWGSGGADPGEQAVKRTAVAPAGLLRTGQATVSCRDGRERGEDGLRQRVAATPLAGPLGESPAEAAAGRPVDGEETSDEDWRTECGAGGGDGGKGGGYLSPELAVFMYPWAFSLAVALTTMHVQVSTRFLMSACPPIYWYMAYLWLRATGLAKGGWHRNHAGSQGRAGQGGRSIGAADELCAGPRGCTAGGERGGDASEGRDGKRGRDAGCGSGNGLRGASMSWCAVALWRWCLAYLALGCVLFVNFYPWT